MSRPGEVEARKAVADTIMRGFASTWSIDPAEVVAAVYPLIAGAVLAEAAERIEEAVSFYHAETGKWVRGADIAQATVSSLRSFRSAGATEDSEGGSNHG